MFRTIISLTTIVSLLTAMLLSPSAAFARRCPAEEPETLLSLYRSSELIVIATFDKIEDVAVVETEESYTAVKTKSSYTVNSTLKGGDRKFLVLEETDYRYTIQESAEVPAETNDAVELVEAPEVDMDTGMPVDERVEPGDTVMMFLMEGGEDQPGLRPVGYGEGIKELYGDKLRAYEARVNELNVIFRSPEVPHAAIADWLVSVTEDPLTRWEGAFELLKSFEELEWSEEMLKESAEASDENADAAGSETSEESEDGTADTESEMPESDLSISRQMVARSITDGQKQILLYLLMNSMVAAPDGENSVALQHADDVLLQLVQRWGDSRLAAVLLDQLRADAGEMYYKYQLMETIARSLGDPDLKRIAEDYSDRMWEDDNKVYEVERQTDQSAEVAATEGTEPPPSNASEPADGAEAVQPDNGPVSEGADAKQTFGQRRAELLVKFIAAGDLLVASR